MSYKLEPLLSNIVVEPIKPKDVKLYTGKVLSDVETGGMNVLQYGKVVQDSPDFKAGDIILYEALASHKTNIGEPRVVLVPIDHIQSKLVEAN